MVDAMQTMSEWMDGWMDRMEWMMDQWMHVNEMRDEKKKVQCANVNRDVNVGVRGGGT